MSFPDAVRSVLRQYVVFSGRARRSEYWWFVLFYFLVSLVAAIVDSSLGTRDDWGGYGVVGTLATVALFLPALGVAVRRMHDTDRSGWWVLINLVPLVGWIVFVFFAVTDSKPDNRFGPNPKTAGLPYH